MIHFYTEQYIIICNITYLYKGNWIENCIVLYLMFIDWKKDYQNQTNTKM